MLLTIREFKEADRVQLRELYMEVRFESFDWLRQDNFIRDTFDADTEGERIIVAEYGQKIVGFISVWEPESFVHHLYISAQFQRQGIGMALLNKIKANAQLPLKLKCLQNNKKAIKFYSKSGWIAKTEGISAEGLYTLFEYVVQESVERMELSNQ